MKKRTASIMDSLMAEPIHMPGFPDLVVTRGFCYQWLTGCGWPQSGRGFGSLDYLVFAAPKAEHPLIDEAVRDYLLGQVRHTYLRGDEVGEAVCEGCGRTLGPDEAHNETSTGARCENCQQVGGEEEGSDDGE